MKIVERIVRMNDSHGDEKLGRNQDLEPLVRGLVWKVLRKWLLGAGVGVISLILGFFYFGWSQIIKPLMELHSLKEIQQVSEETTKINREAQEVLLRMKQDAQASAQASQSIEKKVRSLSGQINSVRTDFQKQMETTKDSYLLNSSLGTISYLTAKQIDTHKFDFPVMNAWIELPFPQCVDAIRIKNIGNQEVTVEIEYPAQDRCHRTCFYNVWATSLSSSGSIYRSIQQLQNVQPR